MCACGAASLQCVLVVQLACSVCCTHFLQDAVSRLTHEAHVAVFSRVLTGEEREEVVQQWLQGQASLTEACAQRQDKGEVGG